jgi:hypothetical protein
MRYLIGVDDTDTPKVPGTGALVRRLAEWLQSDKLAEPYGITRHQLLANKHVHYTGHNSAVCLSIEAENMEAVWETARDFLALEAAPHAHTGLCLSRWDAVTHDVIGLGKRAKSEVVTLEEAQQAAAKARLRFAAVKGNGNGVIGAVSAVGLHREGNDGRFLWLPGLIDLQGQHSVNEILDTTPIDSVRALDGSELPVDTLIDFPEWTRPLLRGGEATLLVEHTKRGWFALDKDHVKSLSD